MLVYLLRNRFNDKVYVGQTTRPWPMRKKWHLKESRKEMPGQSISRAIKKYGFNSFDVQILSIAHNQEQLNNLEKLWIIMLRSNDVQFGYNLVPGGSPGAHHETTKLRISSTMKARGLAPSEEARAKGLLVRQTRGYSAESRQKMRLAKLGKPSAKAGKVYPHLKGRKLSPEWRKRISEGRMRFLLNTKTGEE